MNSSPNNYILEEENIRNVLDISEKMKVPKRIKATGEYYDDHELLSNGNTMNSWNYREKFDMNVPDRIVVIGQDQHLVITSGTKSAPREILLENSILPKDPGFVRVSTPPRMISLSEHHFPSASDEPEEMHDGEEEKYGPRSLDFIGEKKHVGNSVQSRQKKVTPQISHELSFHRETTPPYTGSIENLSSHDEILHLRKQVAKLNRRILNIEIDNLQRQQRDKIICCVGMAYFVLKAILWLNRK